MGKDIFRYCLAVLFLAAVLFELPAQEATLNLRLANPRMEGPRVEQLQERLISLGFTEVGEADGVFGPLTESAVKRFQPYWGYSPTGVVDQSLWNSLFAQDPVSLVIQKTIGLANAILTGEYASVEKDLSGRSTEGGAVTEFFDSTGVRYFKATLYGEMGQVKSK